MSEQQAQREGWIEAQRIRFVASLCDATGKNGWSQTRIKELQGVAARFLRDAMAFADAHPVGTWRCECNYVNNSGSGVDRCGRCNTIRPAPTPPPREQGDERRKGKTRLVYDKSKRTVVEVTEHGERRDTGITVEDADVI